MIDIRPALVGLPVHPIAFWDNPRIAGKGIFVPKWIVLHHTGGVGEGVLGDIIKGHPEAPGIPKANFLIKRDGTIYLVSEFQTYHAGRGGPLGAVARDEMNHWSYGIEVESLGRSKDFTQAQQDSLIGLCRNLLAVMGESPARVINHRDWSRTGKIDTLYSIDEIRRMIAKKEAPVTATDDFISEKDTASRRVRTNTPISISIAGKNKWQAEVPSGRHTLAEYVHLNVHKLPQDKRDCIWRGGVRTWFQQVPGNDVTGGNGPFPIARYGNQSHLMAAVWPHTVDKDSWQFMYQIYAFDAAGKPVDFTVEETVTEIKLIGDKS